MWNSFWYSLGRATGIAARSVGGAPGLKGATGRVLRGTILASSVIASRVPRVSLTAARLCGAARASYQWTRAVLIWWGVQVLVDAVARMLSSRAGPLPSIEAVREQAERIAGILRERDVIHDKLVIDGIPGIGKSTLARALADTLDMGWKSLDYRNLGLPGDLAQERTIFEHHRLFRTQDVDVFDAIIYIDEPVERSRSRVHRRGRGLVLAAALDYEKLKKIGELAFDCCEGEPVAIPESHLVLKIRPPEGFRAAENIASRLGASGVDAEGQAPSEARPALTGVAEGISPDTHGMSKEAMLFLLAYGERREGFSAYLLPLNLVARIGRLAAGLRSAGRRFVTVLRASDSADGNHRARSA